jgi:hypothetical protein
MTHRKRKAAKKLFPKQAHQTRPFTYEDFKALPKGGE